MDATTVTQSAPATVELGGNPAATSQLDKGLISIQGATATPAAAIASFEGGDVVVAPIGSAPSPAAGARIGPVYRQRGGGLAVPTGRVLVRFRPGDDPAARSAELSSAGFELEEVLSYAPHVAWLRSHEDEPVAALNGLERLRSLPGVENVEPQVLTESAPR